MVTSERLMVVHVALFISFILFTLVQTVSARFAEVEQEKGNPNGECQAYKASRIGLSLLNVANIGMLALQLFMSLHFS